MSTTVAQELAELRRANAELKRATAELRHERDVALAEVQAGSAALAQRNTEYGERLEYQAATIDVLKAMSASPGNPQPVFDLIVERARDLCDAYGATVYEFDGTLIHYRAATGVSDDASVRAQVAAVYPIAATRYSGPGRAILDRRIIRIDDMEADAGLHPILRHQTAKSAVFLPLLHGDAALGALALGSRERGGFSDTQIQLLQTFAEQAVIAIISGETYRELRARTEALATRNSEYGERIEHQAATIDVLKAMSASPGDKKPIFDLLVRRAVELCNAQSGGLFEYDGNLVSIGTIHGLYEHEGDLVHVETLRGNEPDIIPSALAAYLRQFPMAPKRGSVSMRAILDNQLLHIRDMRAEDLIDDVRRLGHRSQVSVPLRHSGRAVGVITIAAHEPGGFSDSQVALLQTFAEQAVIAISSAETYRALHEALEQQTATAEVLQVINASPGNLTPVFDAILDKAHTLCGAAVGSLMIYEDGYAHAAATHGLPEKHVRLMRLPFRPSARIVDLIGGARLIHSRDCKSDGPDLGDEIGRSALESADPRTGLWVPLRKEGAFLGWISGFRLDVRPFSDKEIALIESFAAQAVIAMENARLINQTREALEQQTATAEVLQVINASPGNLLPVFEGMLERAMRLCDASFGLLYTYDGERFHTAAQRGVPMALAEFRAKNPPVELYGGRSPIARLINERRTLHIADTLEDEFFQNAGAEGRSIVELGGARTILCVPLVKDEALQGQFTIYRQEARPFSNKQIALLENFAAQAVIAMENARLLNEVRQRQEELRITFENMGDGVAMFDNAQRLVAWNSKFQEVFDLPDGLLNQHRTYEDYLRFLAGRGDFGAGVETAQQIAELVASTGQPYGYERTRPDGRVIEIRRNPVPDGGFVLIFSDITERKRSEVEIRAARDAAEEASRTIEAAYRDLKAAQASLIQAEKMASLGQLTAGIAHEIKNPLNFVNNVASLSVDLLDELKQTAAPGLAMLDDARRAEVDDLANTLASNLDKINEHGRRADGIVRGMLEHSRGSSGERRKVDPNALVEEALNLAYHGARAQDQSFSVTLQREFGEGIAPIILAPQDVTRVLLNLFSNGFYAARERQRTEAMPGFEPTLKVSTCDLDGAVEIRVRDNGIGIPSEIKDRLFQPFFTTKPPGEGTGLGLSMSYDIITQQHGGSISVDSKVGEYSEFTVQLPRSS